MRFFLLALFVIMLQPPKASDSPAHFDVVGHGISSSAVASTVRTAEQSWPVLTELFAVEPPSDSSRIAIHVYESLREYEDVEQKLTQGRFKSNWAFSHRASRTSHVVLQPPCSFGVMKKVGLPLLTRHLIVHEAFHLFGYANVPRYDLLPDWILDGAATYVEEKSLIRGKWITSRENDPMFSTYLFIAKELEADKKLPSIRDIMHTDLPAHSATARYGLRWLLFLFLEEGPRHGAGGKLFRDMIRELAKLKGGSDSDASASLNTLEKKFEQLDGEFAKYVRNSKPRWREEFRSLDTSGKNWPQIAFAANNALAWRTKAVRQDAYQISGRLIILPGDKEQLQVLLARTDKGFLSAAFVAGHGVTVFHFHSKKGEWERLALEECGDVVANKAFSFRIVLSGDNIEVLVNNKRIASAKSGLQSNHGYWGLGAQAGSAGIWSRIKVSPLIKKDD